MLNLAEVAYGGLTQAESKVFEQIIQSKLTACQFSVQSELPCGTTRRTLATSLFAATKKRLASYTTCCWHYMMKVIIAYLNRPKQDKRQAGITHF
jgi:hypothetical protein